MNTILTETLFYCYFFTARFVYFFVWDVFSYMIWNIQGNPFQGNVMEYLCDKTLSLLDDSGLGVLLIIMAHTGWLHPKGVPFFQPSLFKGRDFFKLRYMKS